MSTMTETLQKEEALYVPGDHTTNGTTDREYTPKTAGRYLGHIIDLEITDEKLFDEIMIDDSIDIIVWAARGYPGAIRSPENYGWIDADAGGYVKKVSVKKQLSDPNNDPIIVGAFTFKSLDDLIGAINHMKHREAKVNGEYYIDMAINDAIQIGKVCKIFEIENYICWGTPDDYETYRYWQEFFHKCNWHSYHKELDITYDTGKIKPPQLDYD